jgi:hypothetical protein
MDDDAFTGRTPNRRWLHSGSLGRVDVHKGSITTLLLLPRVLVYEHEREDRLPRQDDPEEKSTQYSDVRTIARLRMITSPRGEACDPGD